MGFFVVKRVNFKYALNVKYNIIYLISYMYSLISLNYVVNFVLQYCHPLSEMLLVKNIRFYKKNNIFFCKKKSITKKISNFLNLKQYALFPFFQKHAKKTSVKVG